MTDLLARILGDTPPESYALLVREQLGELEVLIGEVHDVALLGDIPLGEGEDAPEVLALVPFRQVGERGYDHHDDGAPLRCLVVAEKQTIPLAEAIGRLPVEDVKAEPIGFDIPDERYAEIVRTVIEDEVGQGEGANFVIRRDYLARVPQGPHFTAPRLLHTLLTRESGAYWSFAVVTPGVSMVGASPERHVSVIDGVVTMNPISGTYRHPAEGPSAADFAHFLDDVKEVEELFMVVDEELKMMSAVCTHGGFIHGPYLKQMSRLTHTEYLLRGSSELDVRDILRETMFAPTVTGSPMENACTVIARHELSGRGYYAGVIALLSPKPGGGYDLDAPILIRTAHLGDDGLITVPAGATLVRHSKAESEVAETTTKASGVLAALGIIPALGTKVESPVQLADDPEVQRALKMRNASLSPFWMNAQQPQPTPGLSGVRALIVDAEDRFTTMLAHQLRHFGMQVEVLRWDDEGVAEAARDTELLVAGPGPGDPGHLDEERIALMHRLVRERLAAGAPMLAVCLSHQILASQLGLPIERLDAPRQGQPLAVELYGTQYTLGFYNTFTARAAADVALPEGYELAADAVSGDVFSIRGPQLASIQGHVESILSVDGMSALKLLASSALGVRSR